MAGVLQDGRKATVCRPAVDLQPILIQFRHRIAHSADPPGHVKATAFQMLPFIRAGHTSVQIPDQLSVQINNRLPPRRPILTANQLFGESHKAPFVCVGSFHLVTGSSVPGSDGSAERSPEIGYLTIK